MASPFLGEVAFRAAAYFFLRVCFAAEELFAELCADACERELDAVLRAECDDVARVLLVVRADARPRRLRTCVTGARRTGCDTSSTRPGFTVLERRWFQRRSCSTVTLKRSAIATSDSPARVV